MPLLDVAILRASGGIANDPSTERASRVRVVDEPDPALPTPAPIVETVIAMTDAATPPRTEHSAVGADFARDGDEVMMEPSPSPLPRIVIPHIPSDPLSAMIDVVDDPECEKDRRSVYETLLRAKCDDVARRVIREGGHISMAALARELGSAPATVKRLMSTKLYRSTFDRISDEIHGSIDDRILDERLDVLARGDTLQRRAMTVLAEALELSRAHMASVRAKEAIARPQLLKVAVDAAAEVRQIVSARGARTDNGATVNINITKNHATVIQGAIRESGVDLSDVLGALVAPEREG